MSESEKEEEKDPVELEEEKIDAMEEIVTEELKHVTIAETELEHLRQELSDHKGSYLRQLAEQENMRKRLHKERDQLIQHAIQNVVIDFLNPIDHFENALKFVEQTSEEVKVWGQGFEMILNQFKDVLESQGIQAFHSVGKPFDPHLHEAVETLETDEYPPDTVVEESLKGYKMGDRVIRPARVTVSKAIPQKGE